MRKVLFMQVCLTFRLVSLGPLVQEDEPKDPFDNGGHDQPNGFGNDPHAPRITLITCSTPHSSCKIPRRVRLAIGHKYGFAIDALAMECLCASYIASLQLGYAHQQSYPCIKDIFWPSCFLAGYWSCKPCKYRANSEAIPHHPRQTCSWGVL